MGVQFKLESVSSLLRISQCHPQNPVKALKRCGDQATVERITMFCDSTGTLPPPAQTLWLEKLNNVPDIDTGEVLLFVVGIEQQGSITYIGDKRSLVALANTTSLVECIQALNGRIKCLEQIIAEMMASEGTSDIVTKIRARQDADRAMNMIVGTRPKSRRAVEIWEGLYSYFNHLNECTNGLLAAFPAIPAFISNEPHMVL